MSAGPGRWPLVITFMLVAATSTTARADLDARLERSPVRADETARVVLEYTGDPGPATPDTGVLEDDFEVLSVIRIRQQDVDATTTDAGLSVRWLIELAPRRSGHLEVPALSLAGSESSPLGLLVLPAEGNGGPAPPLWIEMTLEPDPVYVQQMARLSVRVFRDRPRAGALQVPLPEGALHHRLGPDLHYERTVDGRRYRVSERRYALFPQSSGALVLEPARFETADGQGRAMEVSTIAHTLQVRPRAAAFEGGHWLVSPRVRLVDGGSAAAADGRPVHSVRIEARDVLAEQIGPLPLAALEGLGVQRLAPVLQTREDNGGLLAVREERFTVRGDVRMPALRLPWWDASLDLARDATLPPRELPGGQSQALAPTPAGSTIWPAAPGPPPTWPGHMLAAIALAAVLALIAWARTARRRERRESLLRHRTAGATAEAGQAPAWSVVRRLDALPRVGPRIARLLAHLVLRRELQSACARDDADGAEQALRRAASILLPQCRPFALTRLAGHLADRECSADLAALERRRFGARSDGDWRGGLARSASRALARRSPVHPPRLVVE